MSALARLLGLPRRDAAAEPTTDAYRSIALTHIGKVRRVNEDRLLDCPERGLWAVADGMGGLSAGDVAATIAVRALAGLAGSDRPITASTIEAALQQANRAIAARDPGGQLSGSTIAGLHIAGATYSAFWAGDSRVYRYRAGVLAQITHDHSFVQELVDAEAIAPEAAARHPRAHIVTRALGVDRSVEIALRGGAVIAGDRFLICSDGLSGLVTDDAIAALMGAPIEEAARGLVAAALAAGGFDNLSVVLVEERTRSTEPAQY